LASDSAIPQEFGGSWEAFEQEWCRGAALGYSAADASRALSTIARLWPDEARKRARESGRGTGAAASIVDLGLLLGACETADGFQHVFRRLASGERSAYSELVLAAALQRLGHPVRLQPPLDGKVLDAASTIEGRAVFFEVVAPESSQAFAEDRRSVDRLTEAVRRQVSKCRVEIELSRSPDQTSIAAIVAAVEAAAPSSWVDVGQVARVRRTDAGAPLVPTFDGDGTQIVVAGDRSTQGAGTTVIARWDSSDARAKRVFNEEYHQFSETVANVLVVNVCAVADGMKLWPLELKRLLQPARNRKVGAIVFFDQGSLGPPEAIRRRWKVLVNPHAHIQVPERLLAGLESLDESDAYRLPHPARVIA
jgi:hypothetical protein